MSLQQKVTVNLDSNSGRVCGSCSLCCSLLPVAALAKPANTKCEHQKFAKGCRIYHARGLPRECRVWSCRWLTREGTQGMRRPDRAHYVIDAMPDMIRSVTPDGVSIEWMAIQVWVDPAHPLAYRDAELRAYAKRMADEDGMVTVLRFGNARSIVLVAPSLSGEADWIEMPVELSGKEGALNERLRDGSILINNEKLEALP